MKYLKKFEGTSHTDCRTETGITVGLIDGIISISRILKDRLSDNKAIINALNDLSDDEDLKKILTFKEKNP